MDKSEIRRSLGLSGDQARALDIEEDTLLLAGAGAGKSTTLLGALAADLLCRGMDPSEIALVTFTRAAAASLRARLEETMFALGADVPGLDQMWIGTIDSVATRVLRIYSLRQGYSPDIHPHTKRELQAFAREALQRIELDWGELHGWVDVESDAFLDMLLSFSGEGAWVAVPPEPDAEAALQPMQEFLDELRSQKQIDALGDDIAKIAQGQLPGDKFWGTRSPARDEAVRARNQYRQDLIDNRTYPVAEKFLECWQLWKAEFRGISFSHLLRLARERLPEQPLRKIYLDEAQDTSPEQFRFLRDLLQGPLVAVGDPNQSIYGWRGADLRNFLEQTADFPRIVLRDNYRSAPAVLQAVETVCRPLLGDDLLEMRSHGKGGEVVSYVLSSAEEEMEAFSRVLRAEVVEHRPEEITVLLRSNEDLEKFYRRARADGLPVALLRSGGLLAEEECQDLLALCRLFSDPEDEASRLRVLSSPLVGMSAEELLDWSGQIGAAPIPYLEQLTTKREKEPLSFLLEEAIELFDLDLALLRADSTGARWSNALAFLRALRAAEEEGSGMQYDAVLDELVLRLEEERQERIPDGAIRMQTIHQAKGEEYPVVVLPRMGRKPKNHSGEKFFLAEDGQLGVALQGSLRDSLAEKMEHEVREQAAEEEQRLLYVALTRAEEKLILLGATGKNGKLGGLLSSLPCTRDSLPPEPEKLPESIAEAAPEPAEGDPQMGLPGIGIRELSWSSLRAWNRCSLRRTLEGEWGLRGQAEAEGGSGRRALGIAVHDALSARSPESLRGEGLEMYRAAENYLAGRPERGRELPFEFALGEYLFRGRVDVFLRDGTLIDWKTGAEEEFKEDYAAQRRTYALAALMGGEKRVRAETVYLPSEQSETEEWSADDLPELARIVLEETKEILQRPPEPAAQEAKPFCAGCPGQLHVCPVSIARQTREQDPPKRSREANQEELDSRDE